MSKSKYRAVSLVAAGLIAFSGVSTPSVALAQSPAIANPTYSTVDTSASVGLTIIKYKGDPGETNEPLDGQTFRVEKVIINAGNLDSAAAWAEIANLNAETAQIDRAFTPVDLVTGNGNGTAVMNTGTNPQFTVGVYKVTEQARSGFTVAKPFLVTLPFVDGDGVWKYDQTVRPKNQEIRATKQVSDEGKGIGDIVEYTIEAGVPAEHLTEYVFEDLLPKGMELSGDVRVSTQIDAGPSTQFESSGYEVSTQNDPSADGRQRVKVTFNQSGREALAEKRTNQSGLKTVVTIPAKITQIPDNNGTPQRGAYVNEATIHLPNNGTKVTDPVESRFGSLTITKNGTPSGNMVGAKFKLYECTQDGANNNRWTIASGSKAIPATTNNDVNGKTDEFEITSGNTVTVNGIQDPQYRNGAVATKNYCVVETKAPSGYNLNPNPQPVTKNPSVDAPYDMVATVEDVQDSIIGQLPATGEKGIVALMIAGLALLGGGVWARLRHNRKQVNA